MAKPNVAAPTCRQYEMAIRLRLKPYLGTRKVSRLDPREIEEVYPALHAQKVAANTIKHAKSPGSLKIWYDANEIVCQIHDEGVITDPMAGRREPSLDALGGHGLWIVNQVCDQVELQSDENGTTIRLHMTLPRRGTGQ